MYIYIYIYIYVRTSVPRHASIIKERNKVSTVSAYYIYISRATARAADCGQDQRKNRQDRKRKQRQSDRKRKQRQSDRKRKQRQSASEGILKKVKGDDAERRLAKQRQHMANHRARER